MDEYISEKEQIERIRDWWRDNGWYLIGGAVLGLVALFGYDRYQDYTAGQAETASALYRELEGAARDDDVEEVERILAQLRAEYDASPYADQAALLLARIMVVRDTDRAAAELRRVMETTGDEELASIARLRLARVLAYQERYADALALLEIESPGPFAARIAEIRGDIHASRGELDAARAAYADALVADGSDMLDRSLVQMKLGNLQTGAGTAADARAEPSGDEG